MKNSMQNLSTKANEQAASLEETAATLEEVTSIIRNNAQNASKMASLGETVSDDYTFLVSETDIKGTIFFVNNDFCKIAEYEIDELIGK
jgi:hypothetical protein